MPFVQHAFAHSASRLGLMGLCVCAAKLLRAKKKLVNMAGHDAVLIFSDLIMRSKLSCTTLFLLPADTVPPFWCFFQDSE